MRRKKRPVKSQSGLDGINEKIATLDHEVFRLLIERFDNAIELGKIKQALGEDTQDKRRESEVLTNISFVTCRFLSQEHRTAIYSEIMAGARKLEEIESNLSIGHYS